MCVYALSLSHSHSHSLSLISGVVSLVLGLGSVDLGGVIA